jgi:hypothetical protein
MDEVKDNKIVGLWLTPTVVGGIPSFVTGKDGKAIHIKHPIYLDYGNQRSRCLGNYDLCSNGWTVAMWVYMTSIDGREPDYILSSGAQTISCNVGIAVLYYNTGKLRCMLKNSHRTFDANVTMNLKIWFHLTITWSEDAGLMIYLNGNLATEDKVGKPKSPVADSFPKSTIGIPNTLINFNTSSLYIDMFGMCFLDDFIIWERRLSAVTISDLYNSPNYGVP